VVPATDRCDTKVVAMYSSRRRKAPLPSALDTMSCTPTGRDQRVFNTFDAHSRAAPPRSTSDASMPSVMRVLMSMSGGR